jgi:hypothetical protein
LYGLGSAAPTLAAPVPAIRNAAIAIDVFIEASLTDELTQLRPVKTGT